MPISISLKAFKTIGKFNGNDFDHGSKKIKQISNS
jgi:hypothetical protein